MKSRAASLLFTILLAVITINGQTPSIRKNGNLRATSAVSVSLPNKQGNVRFLVIGDTGTGSDQQHELAKIMLRYRQAFPFEFVLMLGDNMYGSEKTTDYKRKFEDVYRPLLDQKVKF